MPKVLYVCLGNICRSPAAEGILRNLAEKYQLADLTVESCGLGDWHVGHLPDERMQRAAKDRGFILKSRARLFDATFFEKFDYLLAADHHVLHELYKFAATPENKAKIHLMSDYSKTYRGQDIPDPYYDSAGGFETVLDMIEDCCESLLRHIYGREFTVH